MSKNDERFNTPSREVSCPECDGAGKTYFSMHDETTQFRCDRCSGTGKIADRRKAPPSEKQQSCPRCVAPLLPHGILKLLLDIEGNAAIGEPSWDDIGPRIRAS